METHLSHSLYNCHQNYRNLFFITRFGSSEHTELGRFFTNDNVLTLFYIRLDLYISNVDNNHMQMDYYRISIPVDNFTDEGLNSLNRHIKRIISNVCHGWDGVEFLNDKDEGRILFRESGVDLRPPGVFRKGQYNFFSSYSYTNTISIKDAKKFTRRFYKESREAIGFDFDIYLNVDYDSE